MSKNVNYRTNMIARTRELLVARFPQCFAAKGKPKKPLKINIDLDIAGALPEIGFKNLKNALVDYTGGPSYLEALVVGAPRYDLNGAETGSVHVADAEHAKARLAAHFHYEKSHPAEAEPGATAD